MLSTDRDDANYLRYVPSSLHRLHVFLRRPTHVIDADLWYHTFECRATEPTTELAPRP